jgi:hypothetical protein
MIEEFDTDSAELVRAVLAEHFPNFAFVILDDSGNLYYDYNNHIIGETLFSKALMDMQSQIHTQALSEAIENIDWGDDEED